MSELQKVSLPKWFFMVGGIALLWNIMGCGICLTEIFAQEMAIKDWTEAQKEWARSTPKWIYLVFVISVVTGVLGSICLLRRSAMSISLFAVSFVTVLIQMGYTMLVAGGLQVMGPRAAVMPSIVVVLAIVWLAFSMFSKNKGWFAA